MTIKETHTDVLIVGAGPSGLMMATWLAKCGVSYRIVDKRNAKIFNGQADGLQSRTVEIFDSLGFADRTLRESNLIPELHLWNPDDSGIIQRSSRVAITDPGLSRFQQMVLHQGRIERFFLDEIANCGGNAVERGVIPTKLNVDKSLVDDANGYPITVSLRHLTEEEATPNQVGIAANGESIQDGIFRSNLAADDTHEILKASELNAKANQEEVVKAKYMLGADGAHSWTRNQLGFRLEGDSTDYIWGVVDIIPITDFPDIRVACTIHSVDAGSILVIPRENQIVRLYVQLTSTEKIGDGDSARFDKSHITPESILKAAQRIFTPYKITYRILHWWTAYQVGQRVGTQFSESERVFLAGDAVHTHSPKAGQGMNTSLQDTYNLGWKVASVVKGLCDRSILKTYQSERRRIAQDLIDFDRRYATMFSGKPAKPGDMDGISMDDFREILLQNTLFISGLAVDYGASVIVAKQGSATDQGDGTDVSLSKQFHVGSDQSLAEGIPLGKRMPSTKVLSQADGCPWHIQELLPSNGRWRVLFFVGDISQPEQRKKLDATGQALADKTSFRNRFTPSDAAFNSVFELLVVHSAQRLETTIFDFPEVFRHLDDMYGYDYSKIYVDEQYAFAPHPLIYETFKISEKGCAVIIRPDQYVSYVGAMENVEALNTFFDGFMLTPAHVKANGTVNGKVNGAAGGEKSDGVAAS